MQRRGTQKRCTGEGRRRGAQERAASRRAHTTTPTVHKQHNAAREKEKQKQKKHGSREHGEPHGGKQNKKQGRDFGVQWYCLRLVQFS